MPRAGISSISFTAEQGGNGCGGSSWKKPPLGLHVTNRQKVYGDATAAASRTVNQTSGRRLRSKRNRMKDVALSFVPFPPRPSHPSRPTTTDWLREELHVHFSDCVKTSVSCALWNYGANHMRHLRVRGVPVPPLFGLGYRTPTFQDTGEEFAVNCYQQRRSAGIKLH